MTVRHAQPHKFTHIIFNMQFEQKQQQQIEIDLVEASKYMSGVASWGSV